MSDFDKRFKKQQDDFNKEFDRAQKFAIGGFICVTLLIVSMLGVIVFVVFKVLAHFGIL